MLSTRAPSGKSMPRKKMSLQPLWVRSMRTGVVSRRMGKTGAAVEKFGAEAQRVVGGMSGAEHPLVAAHAAHAAAHLVGQRLEGERAVAGGQRAGDGGAGSALGLRGQEDIDGLFEAALEQVGVSGEGNRRRRRRRRGAAECGSGGWRRGRRARARVRRGCRWCGGSGRAPGTRRAVLRATASRHTASSERSRSSPLAVITSVSRLTGDFLPRPRAIRDRRAVRASGRAPARDPAR